MLHSLPILDSQKLNIVDKARSSRFTWRGQFSPELIEYLLETLFVEATTIYDPFCGSGTVLFESSLLGKKSIGSEINPAAWCLSSTIHLNQLSKAEQNQLIEKIRLSLANKSEEEIISTVRSEKDEYLKIALTAILLLGTGNNNYLDLNKIQKSQKSFISFIQTLDGFTAKANSYLEDCRKTRIPDDFVDGVITSPPYINVFNYHQNYRPIMEKLGWFPLDAAKSEIGANRKFRQNRFLTVIQYAQDLGQTLDELARVMKFHSLGVMIVGRESRVLGESFDNSKILEHLLDSHSSFTFISSIERVFKNKFGQEIYEDLIIFKKTASYERLDLKNSTEIGIAFLKAKVPLSKSENVELLLQAISKGECLQPSPLFNIQSL
ncbi:site-specific DNA-methyltransferase [Acinetobacter baumannii]|uniref:site-specific DNA-methyltransferase n=1 Tax=Acinetobacter baumannii TaxID=470 RepID=UPI0022223735|nr:site-specific DNA-methyltransferase [Acinetobacter baumannii]MCW1520470.1 site-specific DNA-methyltransferase [Acinetobacter baumannii]